MWRNKEIGMELYTSVTKVRMLTKVRRTRLLPRLGEVVVPIGQEVNPVHVIARATDVASYQILRAANLLGIPAKDLGEHLLVKEGDALKRGTPLMRKPGLFGRAKVYRSPVEGVLLQVRDGCLVMEKAGGLIELRAMVPGRVISIVPGRGTVLETIATQIEGIWDSGKEGFGRLKIGTESNHQELDPNQIDRAGHGSVIVAGKISHLESLEALEEFSVRGLIVGGMPSQLYHKASAFSFPIIVTDGIGKQVMAEPIFELLRQSEGRQASLLSSSVKPRRQKSEIIIPLPTTHNLDQLTSSQITLAAGSQVRVWRMADGATIGRVARVYVQPRKTEVGALLPGADVEFSNGNVQFIPFRNLDLIG